MFNQTKMLVRQTPKAFLLWLAVLYLFGTSYGDLLQPQAAANNDLYCQGELPSALISAANQNHNFGFNYNEGKDEELVEEIQDNQEEEQTNTHLDFWPSTSIHTWATAKTAFDTARNFIALTFEQSQVALHVQAVPKYVLYQQWRSHLA